MAQDARPRRRGAARARARQPRAAPPRRSAPRSRAAAREGAELVVFPETFVPYYPYFSFIAAAGGDGHGAPAALRGGGRRCPGPTDRPRSRDAARAAGVVVALGRERARPRHALQRPADVRRRRHAGAAAAQDHADLPRAHDLGPGRRRGPARGRHRGRARRRARLLGALQPARALRADGRARGDPRRAVPGLAGRADLRRADRGDDPPPRARIRLLRGQRHRLADAPSSAREVAGTTRARAGGERRLLHRDRLARRRRCSARRSPRARAW